MNTRFIVTALLALALGGCSGGSKLCDNKMGSFVELTQLSAKYTLRTAPGCDAHFSLDGTVTPKTGPTSKVALSAAIRGSDCTVISANGQGSDKLIADPQDGSCTVFVPFQAASGVHNTFTEVDLRAQVIAQDPSSARCKYRGPTPAGNTPVEENEQCQLPFE
jgi:hypothetical protein